MKERLKQSRLVNLRWFSAWFTSPPQAAVLRRFVLTDALTGRKPELSDALCHLSLTASPWEPDLYRRRRVS